VHLVPRQVAYTPGRGFFVIPNDFEIQSERNCNRTLWIKTINYEKAFYYSYRLFSVLLFRGAQITPHNGYTPNNGGYKCASWNISEWIACAYPQSNPLRLCLPGSGMVPVPIGLDSIHNRPYIYSGGVFRGNRITD